MTVARQQQRAALFFGQHFSILLRFSKGEGSKVDKPASANCSPALWSIQMRGLGSYAFRIKSNIVGRATARFAPCVDAS